MKTLVGLFAVSACFGVVASVAYGLVTHGEALGIILFAAMAAALFFCAAWAMGAERDANVEGDSSDVPSDAAGDIIGTFTVRSAWPLPVALASAATLLGVLWSPTVAGLGLLALIFCLWRMGAESARV